MAEGPRLSWPSFESRIPRCASLSSTCNAFGLTGTALRELDWRTQIFFERAVPMSPSAWSGPVALSPQKESLIHADHLVTILFIPPFPFPFPFSFPYIQISFVPISKRVWCEIDGRWCNAATRPRPRSTSQALSHSRSRNRGTESLRESGVERTRAWVVQRGDAAAPSLDLAGAVARRQALDLDLELLDLPAEPV
jgi:hypothetical protein